MDSRRHRINPGRIPGQPGRTPKRGRASGSHDYTLGWSQGRLDARAGKAKMPKQRGGGGGKTPTGKKTSGSGCAVWLLFPPAAITTITTAAGWWPL